MIIGAAAAPAPTKGGQCKTVCAPEPAPPPPVNGGVCKVICAAPSGPVTQAKPKPVIKRAAAKPRAIRPAPVRRVARHRPHHYAERRDYYSYRETAREEEHGAWHQAPNDAMISGPQAYGPPPPPAYGASGGTYAEGYAQDYQSYQGGGYCDCAAEQSGLQIDRYGWTGGVGYAGGSEVFVDGYGMVHYGSGRSLNGPTYNSYGQSFQFNPSRAAPFQPRVMGGVAVGGGFGPHR